MIWTRFRIFMLTIIRYFPLTLLTLLYPLTLAQRNEMIKVIRELIAKFAMKKGIVLPFIIILASVALILGAFFLLDNKQKVTPQNQTTSPSPSPANETINTDEETANWKTYTDKLNRFTFKYPFNFSIKEEEGGSGARFPTYYTNLSDRNEEFRFEIGPKEDAGLLEHFSTNKAENINRISWIGVASSEYCDAGSCGPTAPGYYINRNDYYVGVSDFKNKQPSDKLKQILSTFKFLDQPEEGKFCGGIAGIVCPSDYKCLIDGNYPDAGGKCVKK